ncbi:ATPase, P-type (transporting), HAD superfamily, subfamily IC [Gloeothece citriformis PCC 7424]|uniref:ATPase, P-type (Transporting), HAD superfamily, subfamily IC n=1 Tax=Gloeothece citriformis (strain PCC 7424) TaxID=65393 RepID=B7KGT0_GLOC7|nr:cation-transporting P-type ATPase [Gloeothece citriformis]ACK73417.1 ATPase, P-type (transporting), HAD superfamily, subfamily IC [Gloeothece citriformis PCC 7424]
MFSSHVPIWSVSPQTVYETLATTSQGLTSSEATKRLKRYGFNELPEPPRRALWLRFTDQLTHFMALLLWTAGILAFISHTAQLGWAIWAVIWINAIFSFWQDYQAEQALAALKKVLPAQVQVYRDGQLNIIPAKELVPGDVMQLEQGDRISADARLVADESFYVDVSVLTGESLPIARHSRMIRPRQVVPLRNGKTLLYEGETPQQERVQPADIANLVLAGSTVANGRATAVVYATGAHTEFGEVAHLTTTVRRETSTLEIQVGRIVRVITAIALTMGIIVFVLTSVFVGMEVTESFTFAIGIIVALVPEGLLPTVTLALAIGVQRMARRNALVRRLSAVESLSATTVICTDKTGTLTKNEMTVRYLWIPHTSIEVTGEGYNSTGKVNFPTDANVHQAVELLLGTSALCSNARLLQPSSSGGWQELGDPTEAALLVVALKAGLNLENLHQQCPRHREIPFDSRRRMMSVVLEWQDSWGLTSEFLGVTKGAPLEVLRHCHQFWHNGQCQDLTEVERLQITTTNDEFASQGFRVLAVALHWGDRELLNMTSQGLEQDLVFLGLIAMFDPPRPEVEAALQACHQAGIAVTMVTGDYSLTAKAIACQIGLVREQPRVVTGEEMGHLSDAQLRQVLHHHTELVFARMSPEHKLRLVQAYKDLGHIVAVTGDGVNDAPALRAANIGIAMGRGGTDVAREAADIVLLDDNFATIVSAIQQGRGVYQNIRKFITYILSSNVAEVVPFLAMVVLKIPPALMIMQILAVDLGTDLIPALALGAEPPERGLMRQFPRSRSKSLLDRSLLLRAYGFLGLLEASAAMIGFFSVWWSQGYQLNDLQDLSPLILAHQSDPSTMVIYSQATTLTLATILACQDGNVFACRSERLSIFQIGFFNNPLIWLGIGVKWVLMLSIIYLSPLATIFFTTPLTTWQWLMLLIWPPLILTAEELRKRIVYHNGKNSP